tara:strand:+ start:1008 stop:1655 length:648 start_codon:yes stop_codon:yes gene_type:complete
MTENLYEAQYDLTKKSKLKKFYDSYKILIISALSIIVVLFVSFNLYLDKKEKKGILIAENYFKAKVYLETERKNEAKILLKELVFSDNSTYSTLSLFLLINENLITDPDEISSMFDHLIKNNKFDEEYKKLLTYKKTLLNSNNLNEEEMLKSLKPLLNQDSIWKPHALILLGDYFTSKGQFVKAIEFYQEIFSIKNLSNEIYNYTRSQLILISNE